MVILLATVDMPRMACILHRKSLTTPRKIMKAESVENKVLVISGNQAVPLYQNKDNFVKSELKEIADAYRLLFERARLKPRKKITAGKQTFQTLSRTQALNGKINIDTTMNLARLIKTYPGIFAANAIRVQIPNTDYITVAIDLNDFARAQRVDLAYDLAKHLNMTGKSDFDTIKTFLEDRI